MSLRAVGSGIYQGTQAVNTDFGSNGLIDGADTTLGLVLFSGKTTSLTCVVFEFGVEQSQGSKRTVYAAPTTF
jgi:hypothetical protein